MSDPARAAESKRRLPLAGGAGGTPDVTERIATKRERVHVLTGAVCNNNCIFCMEEDREGRKVLNSQTDDAMVERILRENTGPGKVCEEICFTSGEPTTNPRLLHWVRMAKEAGVERISVMTNGRALSYAKFTRRLAAAGMNRFYVSIHGHTAKLHESLVRTPGAFEQTVAGIREVAKLARYGVELHTSTVLTKRNVLALGPIYRFLRGLGVQQVVFNVMQANGRADTHFERIFPPYAEIARHAESFLREEDAYEREVPAFFIDIPLCTTTALPDFNRGYVEAYKHYEADDGGDGGHDQRLRVLDRVEGDLVEVRRSDLDDDLREKRPACATCLYEPVCEGVWTNYLRRFGWDEMQPVTRSS